MRCKACRTNIRGYHYKLVGGTARQVSNNDSYCSKLCAIKGLVVSVSNEYGKDEALRMLDSIKELVMFNGFKESCSIGTGCNCD